MKAQSNKTVLPLTQIKESGSGPSSKKMICQFSRNLFVKYFVNIDMIFHVYVSLGDVINPDRQIDFYCDGIDFNRLFRSEFGAGFNS